MTNTYIYDLEQFQNFHSATFYNISTNEIKQFVIHSSRDDRKEYFKFLNTVEGLIGYNNLNYDYPLLHYLLNNKYCTPEQLYNESQRIIETEYPSIKESNVIIPQLDLMRLWHFNNKARITSLKKLQYVMKWKNLQDLPLPHYAFIDSSQIEEILKYNLNDVLSTFEFYKLSKTQIDLRKTLSNKYNIDVINKPDAGIGEEILLQVMSKKLNINKWDLKKLRTYRSSINFSECILPYVNFNNKEFNNLLVKLKNTSVKETKDSFKESVIYKGFKYDYGVGGIHGCIKPGVYETDENTSILDIDVTSFYPKLAIVNKFYPNHLTELFCEAYEELYNERPLYAKGTPENYGVKIALNGAYGKSNDKFSFLYDPKFTMQITINGQLLLTMLAEKLVDSIEDITVLQINTDGITIKYNKADYEKVKAICNDWENLTSLQLESSFYSKMIIRDVNNYVAIYENGKTKSKGCFEIDKDYHKDHSMKAVRIALTEYFVNNKPILNTLKNCDVYDFTKTFSVTKGWKAEIHTVKGVIPLQKTNRYIIANDSVNTAGFYKRHNDGRLNAIEANNSVIILNELDSSHNEKEFKKNIKYSYYVEECYKIINVIENKQLSLW